MTSFLKLSDVTVEYALEKSKRRALDNISYEIPSQRYTVGFVGESGSGKTTLGMSIMNMIDPPGRITNGTIEFEGRDVLKMSGRRLRRYRGPKVSMVYQSAMNALNPVMTAVSHVTEVIRSHEKNVSKSQARERAIKLLSEVGIKEDRVDSYPHEYSGGMRQRVVIALALALSPKLLIADEPTSALDVVVQKQILGLIKKQIVERGLALLFITHEIVLTQGLVENIAVMYAGEIVEVGPVEKVLSTPLHPYSEMLIGSILTMESKEQALDQQAQSESSRLAIPVNACKFSNRCKYVFTRCREEAPILRQIEKDRWVQCHKY